MFTVFLHYWFFESACSRSSGNHENLSAQQSESLAGGEQLAASVAYVLHRSELENARFSLWGSMEVFGRICGWTALDGFLVQHLDIAALANLSP